MYLCGVRMHEKTSPALGSILIHPPSVRVKGKVVPLQARCGPEGG